MRKHIFVQIVRAILRYSSKPGFGLPRDGDLPDPNDINRLTILFCDLYTNQNSSRNDCNDVEFKWNLIG